MADLPHVFIEVGDRRWCKCCELYQSRRGNSDSLAGFWRPLTLTGCPDIYAHNRPKAPTEAQRA